MKKALIGINPYDIEIKGSTWNATKQAYYKAVWSAGGCPITLNHTKNKDQIASLVSNLDGLLMVGGPDIPANKYKSTNPQLLDPDTMSENRESFDRAIFLESMNQNKKILAICAGAQHVNVIYGGTLIEDIPTLVKNHIDHGVFNGAASVHPITIAKQNSTLSKLVNKKTIDIKSSHHQCINNLGEGVVVTATAKDGVIEAIELKDRDNFIGVQWHPEIMSNSREMSSLFAWLSS
ncbi:MAG: gamma-glutamyl-gamma-aminobutyrate hydrolase family protein [Candidatus Marinimicrobia bacterium]|nr:gamma-glutamyl-gamma-aminobutyrate hydrolase family protein [Candidatus Neomarinimicrobiota bacterium]